MVDYLEELYNDKILEDERCVRTNWNDESGPFIFKGELEKLLWISKMGK